MCASASAGVQRLARRSDPCYPYQGHSGARYGGGRLRLEAIATVLALQEGLGPPTINYENPDPACELGIVSGPIRQAEVASALNNSAGIGGGSAPVVLTEVR